MLFSLLLSTQEPPKAPPAIVGMLVSRMPPSSESAAAAPMILLQNGPATAGDSSIRGAGRMTAATIDGVRVWIDEDLWQSQRMVKELALYRGLREDPQADPAVAVFEASTLKEAGLKVATKVERTVVVVRRFTLQSQERQFIVDVTLGSRAARDAVSLKIGAPPATVAEEDGQSAPSEWVRYPTSYAFTIFGEADRRSIDQFALRRSIIHNVDRHIDEFMVKRNESIREIAATIDPLSIDKFVGKRVADLPESLEAMLAKAYSATAANSSASTDGKLEESELTGVNTSIWIEERTADKSLVQIEMP